MERQTRRETMYWMDENWMNTGVIDLHTCFPSLIVLLVNLGKLSPHFGFD